MNAINNLLGKNDLNKSFRSLGVMYLVVWIIIVVQVVSYYCLFRLNTEELSDSGLKFITLNYIFYVVSIIVVALAIISARNFSSVLKDYNIKGGNQILTAFCMLLFPTLCTGTVCGLSLAFPLAFTPYSNFVSGLSIISQLIFILFPLLSYLGFKKISFIYSPGRYVLPALNKVSASARGVMLLSFIVPLLILSGVNANPENESVVAPDIIGGVLYGVFLILYFYRLFTTGPLVVEEGRSLILETPTEDEQKVVNVMGKTYTILWGAIFLSMLTQFLFYNFQNKFFLIVSYISYAAGWVGLVYGFRLVNTIKTILPYKDRRLIFSSLAGLCLTSLLSLNSIYGGSVALFLDPDIGIVEVFKSLCIIAMLLFTVFPILSYISTRRLSAIFPGLKTSVKGALTLLVASIVLSPLLLSFVNSPGMGGLKIFLNVSAAIVYGLGAYFFLMPWRSCFGINPEERYKLFPPASNPDVQVFSFPSSPQPTFQPQPEPESFPQEPYGELQYQYMEKRKVNPKTIYLTIIGLLAGGLITFLVLYLVTSSDDEKEEEIVFEKVETIQAPTVDSSELEAQAQAEEEQKMEEMRQDSIRRANERIAAAMPTPQMFMVDNGGSPYLKEVSEVRSTLSSMGYKKINANNYVLNPGGYPSVKVNLLYETFEGEYDEGAGGIVGDGMSFEITLTFSSRSEADSFYRKCRSKAENGWVEVYQNDKSVSLWEGS